MLTDFGFKMTIMILMGLLMGAGHADVVPHNAPIFYDNDTLLAPNAHGEMTIYTIVDPTWELNIPGASDSEKIKVTGTADKIFQYINIHLPDYDWPDVDNLNSTSPEKAAQDDPTPNCNVFGLAPYPMVNLCKDTLKQIGNHYFNLGSGPGTCAQVQCRGDLKNRHAAIWWCNDDLIGATVTANDIADLAGKIIDGCIEFDTPISWTRGQIFHETEHWNVIVNGAEKCR
ncbi:hypothetical protein INS49_002961 [Diaporthe citri]|uniref:uncharacterized protein n=1 Tax=Diaporthe citri TaxID=83186 RepID=UPI001C818BED|nr:uncharacterized protein INS49_002961 [Diaporthe citri]KAG6368747.1 hypothetical protein INS49_002961 [Diaporthe citri]